MKWDVDYDIILPMKLKALVGLVLFVAGCCCTDCAVPTCVKSCTVPTASVSSPTDLVHTVAPENLVPVC